MNGLPSADSPTCQTGTTLSCSTAAAARASRRNRSRLSALAASSVAVAAGKAAVARRGELGDPWGAWEGYYLFLLLKKEEKGTVCHEPLPPHGAFRDIIL
jgi:hypothetical protein